MEVRESVFQRSFLALHAISSSSKLERFGVFSNIQIPEEIDRMIRFLSNSRVGRAVDSLSPNALQNLTTDEILAVHSYSEYRKEVRIFLKTDFCQNFNF